MPDFTDAQITTMAQEAEIQLSIELSAIIERFSFPVTAGQAEYTLGSNVTGIRRAFWKGKRLLAPRMNSEVIRSGSVPFSAEQGTPVEYVAFFVGSPIIRLYPSPNETLSIGTGDLWDPSNISTKFIVECEVSPTFTSTELRVPAFARRYYVKDYVLYRLLKREGKTMDATAATYFKNKFEQGKYERSIIRSNLLACIPKQFQPITRTGHKVARPTLPANFGEVCE